MSYHAACADAGRLVSIAEGIAHVHPVIAEALATHEHVCVETTGASREILAGLLTLGERFGLLLVRIEAPLSLCLARIAARDQANQIPMREEEIREIYALSAAVELTYQITLDNESLTEEQILRPFKELGVGAA
jgi:predicted kinase